MFAKIRAVFYLIFGIALVAIAKTTPSNDFRLDLVVLSFIGFILIGCGIGELYIIWKTSKSFLNNMKSSKDI